MPTDRSVSNKPLDVRYLGDISGSYALASWADLPPDQPRALACRARSLSAFQAVVSTPVRGSAGESVTARFVGIGVLRGQITRRTSDGFLMSIDLADSGRAKLAAKLDWMKKRALRAAVDQRRHKRLEPRNVKTTMLLPGNKLLNVFVMDVSSSGLAGSAETVPAMGSPIVVGQVLGRVVRKVERGFAVEFSEPQPAEILAQLLLPPSSAQRATLAAILEQAVGQPSTKAD